MKRFRFQHSKLLRLKRQSRHQSEIHLRHAQHRVRQAQQAVDGLRCRLQEMSAAPSAQNERAGWSWYHGSAALQRSLASAAGELRQIQQLHKQAHAEFKRRDAEYEVLCRLHDKQLSEHRTYLARSHQHDLDESALRKWLASRERSKEGDDD